LVPDNNPTFSQLPLAIYAKQTTENKWPTDATTRRTSRLRNDRAIPRSGDQALTSTTPTTPETKESWCMTSCSGSLYMDAFKPTGMNSFILATTCKLTELGLSNRDLGRLIAMFIDCWVADEQQDADADAQAAEAMGRMFGP
jgi:hypothetical protein